MRGGPDHQQRGADRGWRRTRRPGRDRVGALLVWKTQTSTRVSNRLKMLHSSADRNAEIFIPLLRKKFYLHNQRFNGRTIVKRKVESFLYSFFFSFLFASPFLGSDTFYF